MQKAHSFMFCEIQNTASFKVIKTIITIWKFCNRNGCVLKPNETSKTQPV